LTDISRRNTYFSPNGDNFKDSTFINFTLSKECLLTARVVDRFNGLRNVLANGRNLQSGRDSILWDGKDSEGKFVSDGQYTIHIEYTDLLGTPGEPVSISVVKDTLNPVLIMTDANRLFGTIWDDNLDSAYIYVPDTAANACDSLNYSIIDSKLWTMTLGLEIKYRILVTDKAGNIISKEFVTSSTKVADDDISILPAKYELSQNFPNPFNPVTVIDYALPKNGHVRLTICNILGQTIRVLVDEIQSAGFKRVTWDGSNSNGNPVATGIYFYQLKAGNYESSKKMMLLK
jgi:flagellar hook assembly protein FlgD